MNKKHSVVTELLMPDPQCSIVVGCTRNKIRGVGVGGYGKDWHRTAVQAVESKEN